MRDLTNFRLAMHALGLQEKITGLLDLYASCLPFDQDPYQDVWDVLAWVSRKGNLTKYTIDFSMVKNDGLRLYIKIFILGKRFSRKITGVTAANYVYAVMKLDRALGERDVRELSNEDFYETEKQLLEEGSTIVSLPVLQSFSTWLQNFVSVAIDYKAPPLPKRKHGRDGTDSGRLKKMLPDEAVAHLFSIAQAPDVHEIDRFFINALVISIVLQGRINELATLPFSCLVQLEEATVLKVYTEKGGRLGVRHFPQVLLPAVREAVSYIQAQTHSGRELVKKLKSSKQLDWIAIVKNEEAFRYFSKKYVHRWTSEKRLMNPDEVWSQSLGMTVNAVKIYHESGGNISEAAKSLGISWGAFNTLLLKQEGARKGIYIINSGGSISSLSMSDKEWKGIVRKNPMAVSAKWWEREINLYFNDYYEVVSDIFDNALVCQLHDQIYPEPVYRADIEEGFFVQVRPVVTDQIGRAVLEAEDALFIIPRNLLNSFNTKDNEYQLVSSGMFSVWLFNQCADSNSALNRHGLTDPRTGSALKFTWHDLRHWFQTVLKRGGLTDVQAALLAGRKDSSQTSVYDHTTAVARAHQLTSLREGIQSGEVFGVTTETYHTIKIDDPELAEEYLIASTLVVNSMPHGNCTMNLALTPCEHHLSCLSSNIGGGCCEHLHVDLNDAGQVESIKNIRDRAVAILEYIKSMGGEDSPQYEHQQRIVFSANKILKSC